MFCVIHLHSCTVSSLTTAVIQEDDDMGENPYLAGFEWDPTESWTTLVVHQKKTPGTNDGAPSGGSKKRGKKGQKEEVDPLLI